MKNKKVLLLAAAIALLGGQLSSLNASAYNYGIEYEGGEPLGSDNVNIEADYINSLVPLIHNDAISTTVSPKSSWETGYIKGASGCDPVYYYSINPNPLQVASLSEGTRTQYSYPAFSISNGKYRVDVEILGTGIDNLESGEPIDKNVALAVRPDTNSIYVGWQMYDDAECLSANGNITKLQTNSNKRVFVEMNSKLYKEGADEEPYVIDGMYFGITDIDAAQSYRILNYDNRFSRENMFAVSADDLQPGPNGYKNMYVSENNYIYSEYDPNGPDGGHVKSNNLANIYTELDPGTLEDGIDFVFGFAEAAASGIEYLGRLYNVQYDTDENGEITGILDEDVIPGDYASGSAYKAKGSHKFLYWVADVDVVLDDDDATVIKAGKPDRKSVV